MSKYGPQARSSPHSQAVWHMELSVGSEIWLQGNDSNVNCHGSRKPAANNATTTTLLLNYSTSIDRLCGSRYWIMPVHMAGPLPDLTNSPTHLVHRVGYMGFVPGPRRNAWGRSMAGTNMWD